MAGEWATYEWRDGKWVLEYDDQQAEFILKDVIASAARGVPVWFDDGIVIDDPRGLTGQPGRWRYQHRE